jgi:hypothetical protein
LLSADRAVNRNVEVISRIRTVTKSKLFHRRCDEPVNVPAAPGLSIKRAPLVDGDKVLLSRTHLWLRKIPGHCQPTQLCRHYPRVANALALCWDDRARCKQYLVDLMGDARGDRTGFPTRISEELRVLFRLREFTRTERQLAQRLRRALNSSLTRLMGFRASQF